MRDYPMRMGRINFLNVLPIYHPLETGIIPHEYELVAAPPAVLNMMMARGELQVSSCSCIEYARHPERYYLVPDLCIGSHGPVLSVLLMSAIPPENLRQVLVSGESHTSVALLRLLLDKKFGAAPCFQVGNVSSAISSGKPPEAFLAIGDEALRLRDHPGFPYRVDLAEAWKEWTGLPFIFGLWVVNSSDADAGRFGHDPGELLRRGRDWGLGHMDVILDLTMHGCPLQRGELRHYYQQGLFYSLSEKEIAGLRRFYEELALAGMLERVPQLRFYSHQERE